MMYALSATCPKCRKPVPINGASESVLCDSCQTPMDTGRPLFEMISDTFSESIGFDEGEGSNSTILGQFRLTLTYGRLNARCEPDCKTPYPEHAMRELLAAGGGDMHCTACGKRASVRKPPPWLLEALHPGIAGLVAESLGTDAVAKKATPKEVRFHCYHCGAGMPLDGKERNVKCGYCSGEVMVPDDIWVRLHPAKTVDRWFALFDMGQSAGLLPDDCNDFADFTVEPGGNMVVAYHADDEGDVGHYSRVASVGDSGRLKWLQDGVEFDDDATLHVCRSDSTIVIVDSDGGFIRYLDAATGEPIRTLRSRGSDTSFVNVSDHDGIAIDWDGSILVLRDWEDTNETALRRFSARGERIPLWPGAKLKQKERSGYGNWNKLRNEANQFPTRILFGVGWDGAFYVVSRSGSHIAKYHRNGTLFGVLETGITHIDRVLAFDVSREGVLHLLYEHKTRINDSQWHQVMRVMPNGTVHEWLGPHVDGSPLMGQYDDKIELMPDGRVYLGYNLNSLRIFAPDRSVLFKSSGTASYEKYTQEELDKARRGKKLSQDREG